jgi:hypothetical protein
MAPLWRYKRHIATSLSSACEHQICEAWITPRSSAAAVGSLRGPRPTLGACSEGATPLRHDAAILRRPGPALSVVSCEVIDDYLALTEAPEPTGVGRLDAENHQAT